MNGDAQKIRRRITEADKQRLRELYPNLRSDVIAAQMRWPVEKVYACANRMGLRKSAAFLASAESGRLRGAHPRSVATQFKKGQTPANKGIERRHGWAPGRMAQTQFKKGARSGRAQELWKPVGSERVSKDGYLERKVNESMPLQARWRFVHLLIWEAENGPLPKGHAIVFVDGDRTNLAFENLALVTRAELMKRNSYYTRYPKEVGLAIQLRGQIVRQINKRIGNEKQD